MLEPMCGCFGLELLFLRMTDWVRGDDTRGGGTAIVTPNSIHLRSPRTLIVGNLESQEEQLLFAKHPSNARGSHSPLLNDLST